MYKRYSLSPRKRRGMEVKPVHPSPVRMHGLFGLPYVKEHMYIDDRWTPSSVAEEFAKMTELLRKRNQLGRLETSARLEYKRYAVAKLKHQCRNGHSRLKSVLFNANAKKVRSLLLNHKDMLRLYPRMPMQQVKDNVNQRTFVLRKEVDRLRHELRLKKEAYKNKLTERASIQNRARYINEFIISEEIKSLEFKKKIENSNIRLKAIKAINSTYRKITQVLQHDSIFYEPILRSLNKDVTEQGQFIKHVLHLGSPTIKKFKELSEELRLTEDKIRRNVVHRAANATQMRKGSFRSQSRTHQSAETIQPEILRKIMKRYARETINMRILQSQLEVVEETIKEMKTITLCSQAREICPRIKSQFKNNVLLFKIITNDLDRSESLNLVQTRAQVLAGVLYNNMTDDERRRLKRIEDLKAAIERENEKEKATTDLMKNRADLFVLLRYSFWNMYEILRHVGRTSKPSRIEYPASYLKLPLLKYDMLHMRSYPPDSYELDMEKMGRLLKRKLHKAVRAFRGRFGPKKVQRYVDEYTNKLAKQFVADSSEEEDEEELRRQTIISAGAVEAPSGLEEAKLLTEVPNRRAVKNNSLQIVNAALRKDE